MVLLSYHGTPGPPGFEVDGHYEVGGAQLVPVGAGGQPPAVGATTLIELVPPATAGSDLSASARDALAPVPELIADVVTVGSVVRVVVPEGRSDEVLQLVLAARWSVRSVVPPAVPGNGDRGSTHEADQ